VIKTLKSRSYNERQPAGLNQNAFATGKLFNDQHPYITETNRDNDIESVYLKLKGK